MAPRQRRSRLSRRNRTKVSNSALSGMAMPLLALLDCHSQRTIVSNLHQHTDTSENAKVINPKNFAVLDDVQASLSGSAVGTALVPK